MTGFVAQMQSAHPLAPQLSINVKDPCLPQAPHGAMTCIRQQGPFVTWTALGQEQPLMRDILAYTSGTFFLF